MQISIIIPLRSTATKLSELVGNIRREQTYHHQIILVDDDNSTPIHGDVIERYGCEYIKNCQNLGRGACCDIGAGLANHKYLAFLDANSLVTGIEQCIKLLDENPASIIAPKVWTIYGAYISVGKNTFLNPLPSDSYSKSKLCYYGDVCFVKKAWFQYLRGFNGLLQEGLENSYLSAKSWAAGGNVIPSVILSSQIIEPPTKERVVSYSVNRYFINKTLFGVEYEDSIVAETSKLFDAARAKELIEYYDGVLSKTKLDAWLNANKKLHPSL